MGAAADAPSASGAAGEDFWRGLQPGLLRALLGCPRLGDPLLQAEAEEVRAPLLSERGAAVEAQAVAAVHRLAAWSPIELLLLPPEARCAHAAWAAHELLDPANRARLFDEQLHEISDFEARARGALQAVAAAPPPPPLPPPLPVGEEEGVAAAAGLQEPGLGDGGDGDVSSLLGGASAACAARRFVRCGSRAAADGPRHALVVRALAAVAGCSTARIERAAELLERRAFPPVRQRREKRQRSEPWDPHQLVACMEGWEG